MSEQRQRRELVDRIHADRRAMTRAVLSARVSPLLDTTLTMRQLQLLTMVAVDPGVTPQELADRLAVRLPTVSGLLDRLRAQGLLVRGRHETDRRRHPVSLAPEGERLLGRLMDTNRAVADELYADLDVDTLRSYSDALRALREAAQRLPRCHAQPSATTAQGTAPLTQPTAPAKVAESTTAVVAVGLLQFAAGMDADANLVALNRLADTAVAADGQAEDLPRLLVAPEAAMCDFGRPDRPLAPLAQPLDGPFVTGLSALARRTGATVVAGMFERADGEDAQTGKVFNTLVALAADGDLIASYRKIHLYDAFGYRESDRLLPGPVQPCTIDVNGLTCGLLTCYDLRFPEQAADLVAGGAQALVLPAAWLTGPHKLDHWRTLLRARAVETTSYVVAAGQAAPHYCGYSTVVDPMGLTVTELDDSDGVAVGVVDAARVAQVRELNPTLRNRR
jgi:predicted amidohydrolase/DNA-binding MarR family transcriptional regulator